MQSGGTPGRLNALLEKIDACMHTQPEEALRLCEKAIAEATESREPLAHVRAAEHYGRIMDHQGRGLEAHDILFVALQTAQSERLFVEEAKLLEQIARGYYTAGQYGPAIQYWARCVEVSECTAHDTATWALAKIGLAQVYYGLGDYESGLALLGDAHDHFHEIADPYLNAKIKINLGVGLMETRQAREAEQAFREAREICVSHGYFDYEAESNLRLAQLGLTHDDQDAAMACLDAALASARKVNYRWCEAYALAVSAEIHAQRGAYEKARELVKSAQEIAARDGFLHMLAQQHFAAARYAEAMKDTAVALIEFRDGHEIYQRLQVKLTPERNAELEEKAGLRLSANRLLVELSNHPLIGQGDLEPVFRLITEEGGRILNVSRVSIWELDAEQGLLACRCLYVLGQGHRDEKTIMRRTDCPTYFNHLSDLNAMVAHNTLHHSYTWELEQAYLKPRDIRSMMVFPIRVAGRTRTVLCFGVTGVQRNWTPDDIANANQMAEILARAVAGHESKIFEKEIGDLNVRLMEVNEALEARVTERTSALEQRNAELIELNNQFRDMQNQLLQSEKMASIGQLAAGVAHEINNPIGYVYSNLSSLEKYIRGLFDMLGRYEEMESLLSPAEREKLTAFKNECELEYLREDLPQLMQESKEGITRVKKIVMDLREFSRSDNGEMALHDLNAGLKSTFNLVNKELERQATVICEFGDLPPVECSLARLNQVFLNMLVNAGHALEGRQGGEIRVRTGCEDGEAWISISDNGCGIRPEHLKKIFDAFFTTKPIGKGTGLGLSLSYSIMQAHHGRIDVESEVGLGTTFTLRLPIRQPVIAGQSGKDGVIESKALHG